MGVSEQGEQRKVRGCVVKGEGWGGEACLRARGCGGDEARLSSRQPHEPYRFAPAITGIMAHMPRGGGGGRNGARMQLLPIIRRSFA